MPEMDGIEACGISENRRSEGHFNYFLTATKKKKKKKKNGWEDYRQMAGFDAGAVII